MPNGAKCRETARNPRQREIPDSAKSQTARNPRQREIPNGDKERNGAAVGRRLAFRALRDLAPFGIPRFSGFGAVRHFAPFGPSAVGWPNVGPSRSVSSLVTRTPKLHLSPADRESFTSRYRRCHTRRPHPAARPAHSRARTAAQHGRNERAQPYHDPRRRRVYGCRRRVHAGDDRPPRAGDLHVAAWPRRTAPARACSSSRTRSISRRWRRSASCRSWLVAATARSPRIRRRGAR